MSNLIVEICKIENVQRHNNSDNLDLAQIKGWQVVIKRNEYKDGDKVIFVPPDSLIPYDLAKKLNVVNYLSIVKSNPEVLKVKAVRLRNEPSYGLLINPSNVGLEALDVGESVSEILSITKWEPPTKEMMGNAAPDMPNFHKYTGIENFNNFPDTIQGDEYVIITEKIHGTNFRCGVVRKPDDMGIMHYEMCAGSHNVRRKEDPDCLYWKPVLHNLNLNTMIWNTLTVAQYDGKEHDVVVFGEIYGNGVQDMGYGEAAPTYRLFDISIDGKYLDYSVFKFICEKYVVPMVPVLWEGYFSKDKVKELTDGPTTLAPADKITGKFKGREGIVIRLNEERHDRKVGRVILKSVSADFHARRGGTDSH